MANDWFQFKQFRIDQGECAMKVSTDACIQGAWAALQATSLIEGAHVLDIGTGTGLLSLMLLQANPGLRIKAIEINESAAKQAAANFLNSPWADHATALQSSLQEFGAKPEEQKKYNFIICNPPFFQQHLPSAIAERNDARHSHLLSKEDLAHFSVQLLADEGLLCVLYPESEWSNWEKAAESKGLHPQRILRVKPHPTSVPNRVVGLYAATPARGIVVDDFTIYEQQGVYTQPFRELLSPYYLNL